MYFFFLLFWKTNEVHKFWPLSSVLKSVLSKVWMTSSRKINYSYCNKIAYFVCKIPEKKIFVLPHGMLLGSFSASINRNELPLILLHSHYRLVMGYSHCPSLLPQGSPYSLLIFDGISQSGQSLEVGCGQAPMGLSPKNNGWVGKDRGLEQPLRSSVSRCPKEIYGWFRLGKSTSECPHLQLLAQCLVLGPQYIE